MTNTTTSEPGCEICAFDNPRYSVTAVVMEEGRILLLNKPPGLDLPGGFVQAGEKPEEALNRELKEELGTDAKLDFIDFFPGQYTWNGEKRPVMAVAYLAELNGPINLDDESFSGYAYWKLDATEPLLYETDQMALDYVKKNFNYDWDRVKELIAQLDPSAEIEEYNLYRSILSGIFNPLIEDGKLVGMGWIYPRQTLLRKQAVVEDMIVDEPLRGAGRGQQVLTGLLDAAKKQGVEVAELTTNPKRERANNLYKENGFNIHITNHYLKEL